MASDTPAQEGLFNADARAAGLTAPLALRMRPETFDELLGQSEIVGPGTVLRRMIEQDELRSIILFGPAGSGKTSLAHVIASQTRTAWEELSAVSAGVADVRKVTERARQRLQVSGQKTVLFLDEVHRFNKGQQDALLPAVEEGLVTLIGATTENPYFEINAPLISRSRVFVMKSLTLDDTEELLTRALSDGERGLGELGAEVAADALRHIADVANGDARSALNALEAAVLAVRPGEDGRRRVRLAEAEDAIQKRAVRYGPKSDAHYDVISAFIKSMRGSDPDATLYWLARMLYAGEDPKFIARRIVIAASEDIGLADSHALEVAVAAARAVEFVGLPECRLNLAHAALYVALAPKTNSSYRGIASAATEVESARSYDVPAHLREGGCRGAAELGHGVGYIYPHGREDEALEQEYLPSELKGRTYYEPGGSRQESTLAGQSRRARLRAKGRPKGKGGCE